MKTRFDFVTNSSSSSFVIRNNTDHDMTSRDVAECIFSRLLETSEGLFDVPAGGSIVFEADDGAEAFERFIHNEYGHWSDFGRYHDDDVEIKFHESHH